ncbi:unnamed protein product [Urochloa humidicola]
MALWISDRTSNPLGTSPVRAVTWISRFSRYQSAYALHDAVGFRCANVKEIKNLLLSSSPGSLTRRSFATTTLLWQAEKAIY